MITYISTGVNQLHREALNNTVQRLNLDYPATISDSKIIILVGTKNIVRNILISIFSRHYIIPYFTGFGRLYTDFGFLGKVVFCLIIMLASFRKHRKFIVENAHDYRVISRWTRREIALINGSGFNKNLYEKKPRTGQKKKFYTIGYMSRFGVSKCTDQIIKMIATLPNDCKMIIAGKDIKGTYYAEQFYKIAQSHDNIEMVGFLETPKEVSKFFQSIDVFLYPSIREGLPITLLESIYFQVPFLTTDVAGCSDLSLRCGFPTCAPEDFGNQNNHLNLDNWGRYSSHSKLILEEFSTQTVEKQLEVILRAALIEIQA